MRCKFVFCVFVSIFFISCDLFAESKLIRNYDFSKTDLDKRTVKNLLSAEGDESEIMRYAIPGPIEMVPGPDGKSTAARVDSGWFETGKFPVSKNGFTVEMRVKIIGRGKERGNGGSKNGTIFGMGDGYWSGTRLTVDSSNPRPVFSIGRPQPLNSVNLVSDQPIPFGTWITLAASWDGKTMLVCLNGIPYAKGEYAGDFTDPNWNLRLGFNDAGVGSLVMDIAELKVHEGVPAPFELLKSACSGLGIEIPENHLRKKAYEDLANKLHENDYEDALKIVRDEISKKPENGNENIAAKYFEAEILGLSGKTGTSQIAFAKIFHDESASENLREAAIRRCIPLESATPLFMPDSLDLYNRMIELGGLTESQIKAVQKCIILSDRQDSGLLGLVATVADTHRFDVPDEIEEYRKAAAEIVELKYVPDYVTGEESEIAFERQLIVWGASPWGISPAKNPLDAELKPTIAFYVAPDGNESNPGSLEKPFGSLMQSREAVRKLRASRKAENKSELPEGGIEIIVRGGQYSVLDSFKLEREDSGTETSPIIYRNFDGETPIFSGGIALKNFTKLDDPDVLRRLPEESRGKVYCAKLSDAGFDPALLPPMGNRGYGANSPGASPWVDLYIDDRAMQLARYPNEPIGIIDEKTAFMRTGEVVSEHKSGVENRNPGVFRYDDARVERWSEAEDVWLLGYWKHLWAATLIKLDKIDTKAKELTVATGANPYGYVKNAPFYAINLLEEIDRAGEWYLGRKNGIVYVYPPEDVDVESKECKVRLSVLSRPHLRLSNVSHVVFSGLVFEDGCASGAIVEGGNDIVFSGCVFRRFGSWGISMSGTNHAIISCDVLQLGGGGISVAGGDVRALTPGKCRIVNNHIAHLTRVDRVYGPAISLDGVGNVIAHNLMHDSPAHGMRMAGFSNIVEFNEIHSMVYESDDQSGIDMFGNPTFRGNIIRYNYWHHIGSGRDVAGQSGIRLDDMISSVLMYGNVFYRSAGGKFGATQIHGGKNNVADNNLFIDCESAFSFSPWGEKRWLEQLERGNFADLVKQSGIDISKEPFRSRYPDYASIRENADRNYILRNIAVRCGTFARNDNGRNVQIDNLALADAEIKFDDYGKPVIPYNWPAYRLIGMRPLPIEIMGLYTDSVRKQIPKTEVSNRVVGNRE